MFDEYALIFKALAHPTRLEIIDLLAGSILSLKELAKRFSCTAPAVLKHLKILIEAGIVVRHSGEDGLTYILSVERLVQTIEGFAIELRTGPSEVVN